MRLILLVPVLLLAACAAPAPEPEPPRGATPAVASAPATPPAETRPVRKPAAGRPGAIPIRPINVNVECRFRDEAGYGGRLSLEVAEAEVRKFRAEVRIPKRGVCRFDLAGFRQTRSMPTPILTARTGKCQVRVWEQHDQVTVAFSACARNCSPGAVDYLWPILVDRPKGECG